MAILSSAALANIKGVVGTILQDSSLSSTTDGNIIKYRQFSGVSGHYNPEDQNIPSRFTDWSGVSAFKGTVSAEEIDSDSGIEIGDIKFVVAQSSVSNAVSTSDIIVHSGSSYNVKLRKSDPIGIVYVFYTRLM